MTNSHKEFSKTNLLFEDLDDDPVLQFAKCLKKYLELDVSESIAVNFSTIDKSGYPSSRIVFMRLFDENGFVFFTNYDSNKGEELRKNNKAAMLFYWPELEIQIRIWGKTEKVDAVISDNYFKTRPAGSQAGAWISRQSKEIESRLSLEKMHQTFLKNTENKIIPRPEFWGGYRLIPDKYEFWQGRPNRLHDRFLYLKLENSWEIKRLAP